MVVSIWDTLNDVSHEVEKFIERNYDNYFFWIILFVLLLLVAVMVIHKLGDK